VRFKWKVLDILNLTPIISALIYVKEAAVQLLDSGQYSWTLVSATESLRRLAT